MIPDRLGDTVAFLFTDIAGSTYLWERHPVAMQAALLRHDAILHAAIGAAGGRVYQTAGDAFSAAFARPGAALTAAVAAQQALQAEPWPTPLPIRVRMALHAGPVAPRGGGYFGPPTLNRLMRLLATGHGGQTLLTDSVAAALPDPPPPGVRLRDLGLHRLPDLRDPQHIFDLAIAGLPTEFPPLRGLDAARPLLPPSAPLLGRAGEQATLTAALLRPAVRLLTLTGPGGSGKTHLMLAVAHRLAATSPDGIVFVDLAAVPVAAVPATLAAALGGRASSDPVAALRDYLQPRRLLLILDTFEPVAAAAPLIPHLLAAAPGLKIAVTSRTALHLYGDHTFPLPPLAVPDVACLPPPAELARNPAVALFVARAQAVVPGFALTTANAPTVAALCGRLAGLPLALLLAAERLTTHSPAALLAAFTPPGTGPLPSTVLDLLTASNPARPPRQHSLRASLTWSYRLLAPAEQALFAALSRFPAAGLHTTAPSASLVALLDGSLLSQAEGPDGEPLFRLSPLVRAYAAECANRQT